jgi:transcriptional regulator with XRE-family HTH domain
MTTASNEIGKTLKQQRLSLELTLRELAAKSGVSASHLGRVERGDRFPSGHILRKIAKPLGLDASLLMTMAGYLPDSSSETGEEPGPYRRLDPYVAKVLSEESVHVQRTIVTLFTILKGAIAESLQKPS